MKVGAKADPKRTTTVPQASYEPHPLQLPNPSTPHTETDLRAPTHIRDLIGLIHLQQKHELKSFTT